MYDPDSSWYTDPLPTFLALKFMYRYGEHEIQLNLKVKVAFKVAMTYIP